MKLDLILRADSLVTLSKLAFLSKRPLVVILTLVWLIINIVSTKSIVR